MAETSSNSPTGGDLGLNPGAPPVAGGKSTALGVPPNFKAPTIPNPYAEIPGNPNIGPTQTIFGTAVNPTQYTLSDAINAGNADPQTIFNLQQQLFQAQLLSRTGWRPGVWDIATQNAYSTILGFANKNGLNAQQALSVYLQNPKLGGNAPAQPTLAFANPQDVATTFQNVSQNLTGQEQPTGDFQNSYLQQETTAQHQRGQNYVRMPSIGGAATQYVLNNDPSQVQAYGTASRLLELENMLGVK